MLFLWREKRRIAEYFLIVLAVAVLFLNYSDSPVDNIETREGEETFVENEIKLPEPVGEKAISFEWKYKGKKYLLEQTLYASYYKYYSELPTYYAVDSNDDTAEWYEKHNQMFIESVPEDLTVKELAHSLKKLAEERKFDENKTLEFVASFVQTIPYDQDKLDNRKRGLNGFKEKTTYPYEVLYNNKGVCQDKSYLMYVLLKELGYGVAIFLFSDPQDNHMAVGVKCPMEYSNYNSGFCFLETTSFHNKIGTIPDLIPQTRIATSDIQVTDIETDSSLENFTPLGNVEIQNVIEGKEYTGIINTIAIQRELGRLKKEIILSKANIQKMETEINEYEDTLKKYEKKLKKENNLDDYNALYDNYKDLYSKYKKKFKQYQQEIKQGNAIIDPYNKMNYQFYL